MQFFFLILLNFVLFTWFKKRITKKFQENYRIYLKDKEGNQELLSDTIAYLMDRDKVHEKRILYLSGEMASQWDSIQLIKDNLNMEDNKDEGSERNFG
tara:strand:- start:4776 stop:5069 length:294 start_codon:yes stop_codon:yes gene_type:complete